MEVYGRQHASKFPATPPRQRQHQRYANGDCKGPPPEVSMSRAHFGTTRYSLPTPGSRGSPQSLPPWHGRRQAVPTSATPPHYATPTRVRQVPTSSPQALGTVQANTEQWESLRSRGLVLRGSGEAPRPSVAFAPQLSEIPSQISSSSSSHASITSNPHHRSRTPSFTVHPSLRTGYHPSAAGHYPVPPHNQFMKTPAESLHHPRRQPKLFPSTTPQSIIRYDPVDDALVPRPASTLQQAITFHASSFTPDPIYRARYLVQPVDNSQQDSHKPYAPQTGYERGIQRPPHIQHRNHIERAYYGQSVPLAIPQQKLRQEPHSATSHVPKHVHLPKHVEFKDLSPTRSIFSRPASPVNISDRQSVAPGCFRSSTLHRQETDQSSYSQATLPDTYLRSNIQVSEDHTSTPLSLSDWKPLSVDSVRSSSPNARELWQDLERALLGTPAIGSSEACTPTAISPISETGKGMGEEVLAVAVETTYDFTHSSISHKSVDQHESGNSAYARPPLLRRDRSKDRLEHHRGLGSSIVEKARNSAAQTSRPATTTLASQESIPLADSDGPGVTHVDTPREELKSNHEQSAVTVSKTLKKPVVRNGTRRASKIPVPSQRLSKGTLHAPRKAGVKHTISATLPSQDSPTTESPWASR